MRAKLIHSLREWLTAHSEFANSYDNSYHIASSVVIIITIPETQQPQSQNVREDYSLDPSTEVTATLDNVQASLDLLSQCSLLLLQRATSQKDYFSGNICLPGGKKESNESLVEAAIRETVEETGIRLSLRDLLCQYPYKFIAQKLSTSKNLYTHVFIFVVTALPPITLNSAQIADSKQVPMKTFLDKNNFTFQSDSRKAIKFVFSQGQGNLKDIIEGLAWPAVDVGMKKCLYGLTFYILKTIANLLGRQVNNKLHQLEEIPLSHPVLTSKDQDKLAALTTQLRDIVDRIDDLSSHFHKPLRVTFKNQAKPRVDSRKTEDFLKAFLQHYFIIRPKL